MLALPDDLKEFIELLNAHDARYLIVGGYAVAYHGYPRFTGDIDFFLDSTEENAHKIEAVLIAFGFESKGHRRSGRPLLTESYYAPKQTLQQRKQRRYHF